MPVIDTSAWIDYFEGGENGKEVQNAIENGDCLTPSIVVAELSDNFHRKDVISDYSWAEFEAFIVAKSEIIDLDSRTAVLAGEIKNEQISENSGFSLADGIVAATATMKEESVISSDDHLADF